MLEIWLIRHGMTEGNKHGRYIGVTDEPLCEEGREFLETLVYPVPQAVYASPLLRCRETAGILFPGQGVRIIDRLSECDFGDFENKNYKELEGNADYQAWIDSNGALPFPHGESRDAFRERNLKGFQTAVEECIQEGISRAALVVHGGTIMNIMEAYAEIQRPFYEWHVKNGFGYQVRLQPGLWQTGKKVLELTRHSCYNDAENENRELQKGRNDNAGIV